MGSPPGRPPRAIIFDLDDTLFDCQGQLVLPAHREAVLAMISAGLPAAPEEALRRRLELFSRRPREDVNRLLAGAYGVTDEAVIAAGYDAFHARDVGPIRPFPGALEMLGRLATTHRLFLVTAGDPATQRRKVERLGLEGLLEGIVYVDPSRGQTKERALAGILEETGLSPPACLVVGDRVDSEIAAGRRLGMRTVRIRSGEYAHLEPSGPAETPDVTLPALSDLESALSRLP